MNQTVWKVPAPKILRGENLELRPLNAAQDAAQLFAISHGDGEKESVWKYLPHGPFEDFAAFEAWLKNEMSGADPLMFCVWQGEMVVGSLAIMAIFPRARTRRNRSCLDEPRSSRHIGEYRSAVFAVAISVR